MGERNMHFWFSYRHDWSDENGSYEFCRKQFMKERASVKHCKNRLAKRSAEYVKLYKG
jgi:hypothetical protein